MSDLFKNKLLVVGPAPHLRTEDSIPKIMWSVNLALLPAFIAAVAFFGWYAALVVVTCIVFSLATEYVCQKVRGIPVTLSDGSAVLTGLLLAFVLPPNVPLYVAAIGSVFAISIVKHAFGGLGCNIWNPALAARAFLLAAYSGFIVMSQWPILKTFLSGNINAIDAISKATPLAVMKTTPLVFSNHYSILELLIGNRPGCIGETSTIALLIGAAFLIYKKYINWRLPLAYILTVAVAVLLLPFNTSEGWMGIWQSSYWTNFSLLADRVLVNIFSGGLILGAFFMATDMVTSPLTGKGQVWFGVGCGLLVAIIRLYGGYPEGVCYSILIMNTAVWIIDRYTKPRFFGERVEAKNA